MLRWDAADAPVRERNGLVSRILLQKGDVTGVGLTAAWVDVAPGLRQRSHEHDAEQVYVMLEDRGRVRVGDEEREVGRANLAYIPSGAAHSIEDESGEPLVYVPAAPPATDALAVYDIGRLRAEAQSKEEA